MKAMRFERYGGTDALHLTEMPRPEPDEGEVLIRVRAAAVNKADWHLLRGEPFPVRLMFGLLRPKAQVLGSEVGGTVEAVGSGVTRFTTGEAVFGDLAGAGLGAFAEYVCAPQDALLPKPDSVSFEQAGSVAMSGQTALQGLRDHGGLRSGQHVLVNGASGNVGMPAVQIAKVMGAEVTGVCGTRNVEMVRALGADRVVDYRTTDFATEGPLYDLILDTAARRPVHEVRRALKPGGTYVMVGGSTPLVFRIMILGRWMGGPEGVTVRSMLQKTSPEDLSILRSWLEEGVLTPMVDRSYPLAGLPEALERLGSGQAQGKLVIVP